MEDPQKEVDYAIPEEKVPLNGEIDVTNDEKRAEGESPPPQTVTTYVTVPPDGGWGWVIVAASFMCNLVVDGIVFSFGMLITSIANEFGASLAKTTIAGALLSGFYLISGPFVSALANRYGFRFVGILGSFVGSGAFVISSFATSIESLWLFYGIIGGIGFGLIYVPAVITTGFYFEKWRALATGISVTGSGIGTIIMGPITTKLINLIGWRGTLMVHAGIILNCAVFGSFYRPLKPVQVTVSNDKEEDTNQPTQVPLLQRIKLARDQLRKADSTVSIENEVGIMAVPPSDTKGFLRAKNNSTYPTAAEVLNQSRSSIICKSQPSLGSHQSIIKNNLDKNEKAEKRLSVPLFTEMVQKSARKASHDYNAYKEYHDNGIPASNQDEGYTLIRKHSKTAATIISQNARRDSITLRYRQRTLSDSSQKSSKSRRNTMDAGVRPFYREDIFFQGSLHKIPQYKSQGSGLNYTMSVTHLPTYTDVQEEEDARCQLCPEAVRRTLATMLDLSLLTSPTFILFCVAGAFTMMGLFIPFIYIVDRATINGMDSTTAVLLLSAIGVTNTVGRIACGAITSVPGISSLAINNIALTIGGIATMFSGLSYSPVFQFGYATIFGLAISCFASLRSILIVDLIGLESLTNAFGLLLLFQGVAAVVGSPLAGMFMDLTGSYDASFYLSGGLILISGVMCYPLNWLKRWEDRRNTVERENEVV